MGTLEMINRKTARPKDDPDFAAIAARIDSWLSGAGYRRRSREGSVSWLGTTSRRGAAQTLFKLCFYGHGDVAFGVRREFLAEHEKLRTLTWPIEFAVPPQTAVVFCGLRVSNDDESLARLERILTGLGVPRGQDVVDTDYAMRQATFDEALGKLGL